MSRKRDRRIAETANEFTDKLATVSSLEVVGSRSNDDLFVLDRVGAQFSRKRARVQSQEEKIVSNVISKTEKALLKKAVKAPASVPQKESKSTNLSDIWGSDNASPAEKMPVQSSRKTKVVIPGMSYNPRMQDHQDAVTAALALEVAKTTAANDNDLVQTALISTDRAVLNDSDNEEEDMNSLAMVGSQSTTKSTKKTEKLTRAQRNKLRTRNIAEYEQNLLREQKKKLKQVNNIGGIIQELRKTERIVTETKAAALLRKKLAEEAEKKAMSYEEAGCVPLTDELAGNMRQIIPKGVFIRDKQTEMRNNGDLMARDRRNRRTYEKPHADKKVVWVPKYKVHELAQ
jgi:hypothetical protein